MVDVEDAAKRVLGHARGFIAAGLSSRQILTLALLHDVIDLWNGYKASDMGKEICAIAVDFCDKQNPGQGEQIVRGPAPLPVCTVHGPSEQGFPKHYEVVLYAIHDAQPLWACYLGQARAAIDSMNEAKHD